MLQEDYSGPPVVTIVCPGDEIPNWFVHQNEGASINVRLLANWFREGFLGFALSVVAASNLFIASEFLTPHLQHVFALYKDLEYEERTKWSSAFYDRVTEVSVHFRQDEGFPTVEKCGMCLLYAEDAEKLKCDVMSRQEQDEHAASGSGDPEASGSNESEEASGSDDSEGDSGSDEEAKENDESEEAGGRDESQQASGNDEPDASRSD